MHQKGVWPGIVDDDHRSAIGQNCIYGQQEFEAFMVQAHTGE